MPQSLLTGQLEKPKYRVWCLYSSFVHARNGSERNSESFASILFHGTEFRAFISSEEWVRNGIPRFLPSAEQAEFRRNKPIFPPIQSSAE
jgi:hypothetical protein